MMIRVQSKFVTKKNINKKGVMGRGVTLGYRAMGGDT